MDSVASWLITGGVGSGFAALLWITLNFWRSSKGDTVAAYADLYVKVSARCEALEKKVAELERALHDERMKRLALERELAAQGNAAAYLLKRKKPE